MDGQFPESSTELIRLKGIGHYTAAAIASFCFNEHTPVIDGNVMRVLSRVFDIDLPVNSTDGEAHIKELAKELIDKKDPATFNQAIMEFGALQCIPKNPDCATCPLIEKCLSYANETVSERPVKIPKKSTTKRYFHYAVFKNDEQIILKRRSEKDIWMHLYEFPLKETFDPELPEKLAMNLSPKHAVRVHGPITHVLSHQKIVANFYQFDLELIRSSIPADYLMVSKNEIVNFPFPKLIENYLSVLLD